MFHQQPQRVHVVNVEDEQIHTDALHKLPPRSGQHSHIEGERRQVTVLFGDIAGFTAISEKLDAEDLSEIVRSLHPFAIDQ